ncbi:hypothetical protein [Nonomuraea rubra]|uniref:hypothetical protein n=1 Tax=Nonomuraea rubra TaxID=46180 RepID=UPI0031E9015A
MERTTSWIVAALSPPKLSAACRRRDAARVTPAGHGECEAVQEEIGGLRRTFRARAGKGLAGDLGHAGAARHGTREQRRAPGVEVGLARQPRVEGLKRPRRL